ncbi:MAG: FAD-dependent oxidoreductase [Peptostreptococcaceae bacterium]
MRILVIGAVAAGTSAAAKARRNNDHCEIVIYEKDLDISYSGCGLPYFIGGEIETIDELTPRDANFFKKKYNIDVLTGHEVLKINKENNSLTVKNLLTGDIFEDKFDKLIISTGATPFVPNILGNENNNIFVLRNVESARKIRNYINNNSPKNAVIVGTGFIGFEMLENLINENIDVTIIEKEEKITPNLDEDMALFLENSLLSKGIKVIKNTTISKIENDKVILSDNNEINCDMIIMATGVKPNVYLAKECGVEIGTTGAIKVNNKMQTNLENIYACGDCIETFSIITNKPTYRPLGSTANKTGRIAGDICTGGNLEYRGNLSSSIFKLFDMTIASTGLNIKEATDEGFETIVCHNIKPDKPSYFNGKEMVIKAIADKETQRILGVQIIGSNGVDKRIDVFATLITYKATVDELFHLDLAYAPPFSTTKDPVHYTGMILDNALNNNRRIITTDEIKKIDNIQIIDARVNKQYEVSHVDNAVNMPHKVLRDEIHSLDKDILTVTYCNKGVTGNAAQNILINAGFKNVYNLSGGHKFFSKTKKK